MELEQMVNLLKFYSHYVKDEIVSIGDEYFIRDVLGESVKHLKIRRVTKYEMDKNDCSTVDIVNMIRHFPPQAKTFIPKSERVSFEELDKLLLVTSDDWTSSRFDFEEIFKECIDELKGKSVKIETYVFLLDNDDKPSIQKWMER